MKDDLFLKNITGPKFEFNEEVARVFDDMLERSIPFYLECQQSVLALCSRFAHKNSVVYDLGCSTGTLLELLALNLSEEVHFTGIDLSAPMLEKAHKRMEAAGMTDRCKFIEAGLETEFSLVNASVVVMNYTLQFIEPAKRQDLIQRIFSALQSGGCLILIEKIKGDGEQLKNMFIDQHHRFKRDRGYSQIEIARKKEALENILIPFTEMENLQLLRNSGFQEVDTFFRWFNFCGFAAIKTK